MDLHLTDKVTIVTGASAGIGRGIATLFAQHGAKLIITGRNETNLLETKALCLKQSSLKDDDIVCVLGDVADESHLDQIIQQAVGHFKKIDILINNAGHTLLDNQDNFNLRDFDLMMRVHVGAVAQLCHLATPHLVESRGNIVNISSLASIRPYERGLSYSVAKAAMDQLGKCLSLSLGPKGVRVNTVNPGSVATDILTRNGMSAEEYASYKKNVIQNYPLRKMGEVHEIATTVAFLASANASFISGVCLPVDGGKSNFCPR